MDGNGNRSSHEAWTDRTRVVLSPISAPSILGLFGFAGATLIVGSHLAGWWGNAESLNFVWPFALAFGGIAQLLAGMWSYRARDGIATAMHGMWGSFWIGWGILYALYAFGVLDPSSTVAKNAEGFWFVALAWITWSGAAAAAFENVTLLLVLGTLATGSTLAAIGLIGGVQNAEIGAGWVFVTSAVLAWYLATAMMVAEAAGKVVLPLGKYKRQANIPGESITSPIAYREGMPGARVGQ